MTTNGSGVLSFSAPSFIDSSFYIFNSSDNTKKITFGAQNVTTGSTVNIGFA